MEERIPRKEEEVTKRRPLGYLKVNRGSRAREKERSRGRGRDRGTRER
jgi:hypothetical protein